LRRVELRGEEEAVVVVVVVEVDHADRWSGGGAFAAGLWSALASTASPPPLATGW
jgi:hypothetical protein